MLVLWCQSDHPVCVHCDHGPKPEAKRPDLRERDRVDHKPAIAGHAMATSDHTRLGLSQSIILVQIVRVRAVMKEEERGTERCDVTRKGAKNQGFDAWAEMQSTEGLR